MRRRQFCPYCGGPLRKKIIEDRERKFCPSCGEIIYENPVPASAAVVIDDKERLLLVRRSIEPKRGMWCLPGGFVELDEGAARCCLRELREETNLRGRIGELLGVEMSENRLYTSVMVVGYRVIDISGEPRAADDCDRLAFFDRDRMPEIAFRSHRRLIEEAYRRLHRSSS